MKLKLQLEAEPTPDEIRLLEEKLYEFNSAATGIDDARSLAIFARAPDGEIQAALCGHTWGGCCEIRQLWVHQALRRRGIGRALVDAAESEARSRGCRQIVLQTHSFQAPDFYRKLGFEIVGAVENYPEGHQHLVLRKTLDARKPRSRT